ncbi:hypothetical protein KPH14_003573 [Odynerus spinipes]|uniref:Uncharacterized protein n=1 Tax=Odynerus spinipes TaxID=1348599 RepID=A0AAD9VKW8_9HYME|nr:hypothetical protein KPH14_003573 [Odynerus spinipes]
MEWRRENDAQKRRDRQLRGQRSRGNTSSAIDRLDELRQANRLIKDLENHGPAGLVHLAALTYVTRAPIRIWNSGNELNRIIGEENEGDPIDVEFHVQPETRDEKSTGHWTLRGRGQPSDTNVDLNNCLFSVIAAQVGRDPEELRRETINRLKKNIRLLASHIKEILWLEEHRRIVLLIGGARYTGTSPRDAARILDNSQNARCYNCRYSGHPRGHASYPSAGGTTDSVENYSHLGRKTGFLSREEQDEAAHIALTSQEAKNAMNNLNRGMTSASVHLFPNTVNNGQRTFPKGKEFFYGQAVSNERDVRELVLILRHHEDKYNDPDADVFVHTFYPKLY